MKKAQYGALLLMILSTLFSTESKAFVQEYDNYLDQFIDDSLVVEHRIKRGKLHKSGELKISRLKLNSQEFIVSLRYKVKPKLFVPFPKKHRQGGIDQVLPIEFASPEGYARLERDGELSSDEATLVFMGREDIGKYKATYKVKVLPVSGKWWTYIWYHQDVKSTGWLKIELVVNKIKFVGKYKIKSILKGI